MKLYLNYNPLTRNLMKILMNKNINIHMLINRFKKVNKLDNNVEFPEAVVQRTCRIGLNKEVPKGKEFPWFQTVIMKEWQKYNVEKNIKETELFEKGVNRDLLKQLFGENYDKK